MGTRENGGISFGSERFALRSESLAVPPREAVDWERPYASCPPPRVCIYTANGAECTQRNEREREA